MLTNVGTDPELQKRHL